MFRLNNSQGSKFIEPVNDYLPTPTSGLKLRLGSGTGERGTYGPSNNVAKVIVRRVQYPTQFGNGDLIESVADAVFWHIEVQGSTYPS